MVKTINVKEYRSQSLRGCKLHYLGEIFFKDR